MEHSVSTTSAMRGGSMYKRVLILLLILAALPSASADIGFNYTSALVVPDYTANDTLYIVPYELVNVTIGIDYPDGNETYNITPTTNTGYYNNSSGVVRVYSDQPVAVYHVSDDGVTYLDNSLSYTIDIQTDVHTTVSIIDYINEELIMIGYMIFIIMTWLFAVIVAKNQVSQLVIAMTATMLYIMTLLEWLTTQDFLISLLLLVAMMGLNYILAIRGHNGKE